MHEMAVTANVLQLALDAAKEAGAESITSITLVIGELSSIVDDSVQMYFDLLSEGTPATGATLIFHRIPASLYCRACDITYPKEGGRFTCPHCGHEGRLADGAKEFYLESIEVE